MKILRFLFIFVFLIVSFSLLMTSYTIPWYKIEAHDGKEYIISLNHIITNSNGTDVLVVDQIVPDIRKWTIISQMLVSISLFMISASFVCTFGFTALLKWKWPTLCTMILAFLFVCLTLFLHEINVYRNLPSPRPLHGFYVCLCSLPSIYTAGKITYDYK